MLHYAPPVRDMMFGLTELFNICDAMGKTPRFSSVTQDLVQSMLEQAGEQCRGALLPLNAIGDQSGCQLQHGEVSTPPGFQAAFKDFADGGWIGLFADEDHGGQALPETLNFLVHEMIMATNFSFGDYVGLPQAAYRTLRVHGSRELQDRYLSALLDGRCGATMCMTEPHCGTDIGLIRTRAAVEPAGCYAISGTKIFISAGDQDLTPNILHLVLARLTDAPAGTKGLSLFAVPKFLPDGSRNTVRATQLEHKMGYNATATCEMQFENARGWLVGELNKGLRAMFVMVNTARLLVAVQGLGTAEVAYQNAARYARERLQGRSLRGAQRPELSADPLIVQPDVRRLLLGTRAFVEGARGLLIYTAWQQDLAEAASDPEQAANAARVASLLTPVVKATLTDRGFQSCNDCLQIFGGHGYIASNGMEQLVRDCRIALIQEGANGIQALDLIGRKLTLDDSGAYAYFLAQMRDACATPIETAAVRGLQVQLDQALDTLESATRGILQRLRDDPIAMGAVAYEYLRLFGVVALGWVWLRAACVAARESNSRKPFYAAKLQLAQYYFERELPAIALHSRLLTTSAETIMALPDEQF